MTEPSETKPAVTPAVTAAERPLSPHLHIYKPQITSVLSIMHRITGVGLAGGLVVLVAWLISLTMGLDAYVELMNILTSPVGQIVMFGLTFSFFFHFCNGIRHLLWDAGWCLELPAVYSTGRIAAGIAVLLTAGVWLKILGYAQCPWM